MEDIKKYLERFPELAAKKWHFSGNREAPLLFNQLYLDENRPDRFEKFYGIPGGVKTELNINNNFYDDVTSNEQFFADFMSKIAEDTNYFRNLRLKFEHSFEKANKFADYCKGLNIEKLSTVDFIKLYEQFLDCHAPINQYSCLWYQNEKLIDLILQHALEISDIENRLFSEIKENLFKIELERQTFASRSLEAIKKLAIKAKIYKSQDKAAFYDKVKHDPEIVKDIENYLDEFVWIKVRFWTGEALGIKDVSDLVFEEIKVLKDNANHDNAMKKDEFFKNYKFTDEAKSLVEDIIEHVFLRTYRRELGTKLEYSFINYLKFVSKKMGLDFQFFPYLATSELHDFVYEGLVPDTQAVKKRKDGYDLLYVDLKYHIIPRKLKEKEESQSEGITELKGIVANQGKVRGKARVILSENMISEVENGEIVVAGMTNPNHALALRKAVGIVTDRGGMLCHAAILSRELNIPCIINTLQATQMIKTGDLVEIDTDNGLVKLISNRKG